MMWSPARRLYEHHAAAPATYSPELNPIERLWAYLKSRYLSNQVFKDDDDLFDRVKAAWRQLDEPRLQSLTNTTRCADAE